MGTNRNERCESLQRELTQELMPFAVPLLIAPDLGLLPSEVQNATGVLLDLGAEQCLVTCKHVWDYLQTRNGKNSPGVLVALLGEGSGGAYHIEHPKIVIDEEKLGLADDLDLAVIDVTGIHTFGEKKLFPFTAAQVCEAVPGDTVVVVGFPAMWRKARKNACFVRSGPLPLVVGDATRTRMVISESNPLNKEVFAYMDAEPRRAGLNDSCGGLSGSPVFFVRSKPFRIAGFIVERAMGALMMTRASAVMDLIS